MRKLTVALGVLLLSAGSLHAGGTQPPGGPCGITFCPPPPPVTVPEPASLALLAGGMFALGAVAVRRKQS